jgi:hypothetical protein
MCPNKECGYSRPIEEGEELAGAAAEAPEAPPEDAEPSKPKRKGGRAQASP